MLPIYPHVVGEYVYSVNLFEYVQAALWNRMFYWMFFGILVVLGILKVMGLKYKALTNGSIVVHIVAIVFLALTREAYAGTIAFLLLVLKSLLILKSNNV